MCTRSSKILSRCPRIAGVSLLWILLATGSVWGQDVSFIARRDFAAGGNPFSVAVGDFNGDGVPDLAVANFGSNNVSVLLGNGDGSLRAARNFVAGSFPVSVAVGDFNGDGVPDLAVANQGAPPLFLDGGVSLLLGNGDGSFQAVRNFAAGTRPVFVAVGDFNRDGVQDLAVANFGSFPDPGNVSVLLGNGDGSFRAARNFAAGSSPVSVAVGDFDGDEVQDLAVANSGLLPDPGNVSVLLGNGDGSFRAAREFGAGSGPRCVAVGDFNGDGKPDLAVASATPHNFVVSVLLGNGDGTFRAAVNYGAGRDPRSVAVGDFNGDGVQDLAVANQAAPPFFLGGGVLVLLGNGDGTFQAAREFGAGLGPNSVAVGDFNGDGVPDLAVANQGSNNVSVLLGNGDGSFQGAPNFRAGDRPQSVAVGDFNGDGMLDLAVTDVISNNVSVLLGNGDGTFRTAVNYGAGSGPQSVAVNDFNGDGVQDLAVANSNGVSVLLGNGDGSFQAARNFAAGIIPQFVAIGDFNGDGMQDLAVANFFSNNVSVLLGNGDGSFRAALNSDTGTRSRSVAVGDFNGDGVQDLAVAHQGTPPLFLDGGVSVLLGNGDGTFQAAREFGAGSSAESVVVGEFNGDGAQDLAVVAGGGVSVLLGNGDGTFRAAVNYGAGVVPRSVAVGDFIGDAVQDLVVANAGNNVSVLLGNGDGTFRAAVDFGAGSGPVSVAVGDFNGDGKLDLAVANSGPFPDPGNVSVLINNTPRPTGRTAPR